MSECVEWQGYKSVHGYGQVGRNVKAHRLAYIQHHGLTLDDIEGLIVMHSCDNPPCVNVDHLRLGTQFDNMADMTKKGRRSLHLATLNGYAVMWIRSLREAGHSQRDLARDFGVSEATVSRIITRKTWKHV